MNELARTTTPVVVQLPHDDPAERAVLRAAIVHGGTEPLLQTRNAMYSSRHRAIADAVMAIASAGGSPGVVAVRAELERRGNLEEVGGASYLAQLMDEVPHSANLNGTVDVIQNRAWRRAVLLRSQGLIDAVALGDSDSSLLELLDSLSEERPAGRPRVEPIDLYGPPPLSGAS